MHRFYALAAAAIGILSLCTAIIPALGCVMGTLGIFLGLAGRHSERRQMAVLGIALSTIGLMTAIIYSLLVYFSQYST